MPDTMNYNAFATYFDKDESHIRVLLMHVVHTERIGLKELQSEDIKEGKKVIVRAFLYCDTKK